MREPLPKAHHMRHWLLTTHCLPTSCCLFSVSVFCFLFAASYFLLPTSYFLLTYLLLPTYYLLPTTYYLVWRLVHQRREVRLEKDCLFSVEVKAQSHEKQHQPRPRR